MEDFPFPSQGFEYGYDFVVETDPTTKLQVEVDIMSDAPVCGLNNRVPHVPESPSIHIIQLCKDEYPKGDIKVVIRRLSVLIENDWQATWTPPSGD